MSFLKKCVLVNLEVFMSSIKTAISLLKTPGKMIMPIGEKGLLNWLPDELYLKLIYRGEMGNKLNLDNPQTYNEKLQWIKLYDHNPLYTKLVDKYEVKSYVAQIIGDEFIIPTIGVWDNVDQIIFDQLPNQYVLKCTHDSGSIVICKDKTDFDTETARKKLNKCIRSNFYKSTKEWPYKDIFPRVIAEPYMEDSKTDELRDYKFFCFDGEVKAMFISTDRQAFNKPTTFDFFDAEYRHLDIKHGHPNAALIPPKPRNFELMKKLAHKLSVNIPHVRVDFYEADGKVYFGEMTFFHHGGLVPFDPPEWDYIFGAWLTLPLKGKKY